MAKFEHEMERGEIKDSEVLGRTIEFVHRAPVRFDYLVRRLCVELRQMKGMDTCPILYNELVGRQAANTDKSNVVQIVIHSLPIPDESTSWEQILEFRSDPDSASKFAHLRNWMNDVSRNDLSPNEIKDKLELLLDDYNKHMKNHGVKTRSGSLVAVLKVAAGLASGGLLAKLSIVEALYSLKRMKTELLEGELNAPGREVAYLIKANEAFPN